MSLDDVTAEQALDAFNKARKLDKQARDARARSYRRTPGTVTAQREWDKADEYSARADEQWEVVAAFLDDETYGRIG